MEERIRSDGISGVKKIRLYREGTRPYYADTHIGLASLGIHDHSDYDRTLGMGEFIAVLNGVEFRTRHNDYKLLMPSKKSGEYHATEDIPLPPVPPEVLRKSTVEEQVLEMREWFRAFKEQNTTIRDYRRYFRPVLCALEGGWTLSRDIEEPFPSDRHHLDAASWEELEEKIVFSSYNGGKHNSEDLAYLPTKLYGLDHGSPQLAQWNYRIICHPLSINLPTSVFKLNDDLAKRLAAGLKLESFKNSRAARFTINEFGIDGYTKYSLLDLMMSELPGLDNYLANITDNTYGNLATDVFTKGKKELNAGFYHRWFQYSTKGAMGENVNHRGFNDETLWVAMTTQPNIMPISTNYCRGQACELITQRVTYAIPLEVVYTTPLFAWNPYSIAFKQGDAKTEVTVKGRNGGFTRNSAFNGTHLSKFYRTPVEFYVTTNTTADGADTAASSVGVLDSRNQVRRVTASGQRIITPDIPGVGSVRLRYPIYPVHSEGSTVGRELEALKELVVKNKRYTYLLDPDTSPPVYTVRFVLSETSKNPPGLHSHELSVTSLDLMSLLAGKEAIFVTSQSVGHSHELKVRYDKTNKALYYVTCDGQDTCWDGHPRKLIKDD